MLIDKHLIFCYYKSQVGEFMTYKVIDGKEDYIKKCGKVIEISIDNLMCLEESSKLFEKIILNDEVFKLINFPSEILLMVVDVIINDNDINHLNNRLTDFNVPLYSLIINVVNNYKRKFKGFKLSDEMNEIIIVCNKDNFIKILDLSKKLNKNICIDGQNISLSDYKRLLENYDLNILNNIQVKYQEQNSPISIQELYKISVFVDAIIQGIERYNLSPLEKIIYTYDIVKYREYKESYGDLKYSRDLDKVVQGESIVCVGYSNLFNAILRGMGFNAISLISTEKRHQRSMVYIYDEKYKIDGIYAFDPTFDRRKNDDYIDNYKYFAMTMENSEKDNPSIHKLKPWTTFDELIDIYELNDTETFNDGMNKLNELEDLFDFVHETEAEKIINVIEGYSYVGYEMRDTARKLYKKFMKKYKTKEISPSIFMNALLRTRIIECYTGIISDFDILDVIEAAGARSVFQKINYKQYSDPLLKILDMMNYNEDIYDSLEWESSVIKDSVESDKLKVRLLKVLRSGRK